MDKLYIDVFVPGINKSYDIMLMPEMNVRTAAEYIFKTVREYEQLGEKISAEDNTFVLCSRNSKKILDGSLTLAQCEIKDGAKLILI